jgi:hypothetical protein
MSVDYHFVVVDLIENYYVVFVYSVNIFKILLFIYLIVLSLHHNDYHVGIGHQNGDVIDNLVYLYID